MAGETILDEGGGNAQRYGARLQTGPRCRDGEGEQAAGEASESKWFGTISATLLRCPLS